MSEDKVGKPIFFSAKRDEVTADIRLTDLQFEEIEPGNLPHTVSPRIGIGRPDLTYPIRTFRAGEMALGHQRDVIEDVLTSLFSQIGHYAFEEVSLDIIARKFKGAPQRTPQSGDGGLDGIVRRREFTEKDVLIQCKQWATPVGIAPVKKFIEDCMLFADDQGKLITDFELVFVSLGGFSAEAVEFIIMESDIIRVDADQLAEWGFETEFSGLTKKEFLVLDRTYWRDLSEAG